VLLPALHELARRQAKFTGVLYAGLMIDANSTPNVVEFNCRLGDPEAQVVLPRIKAGLLAALHAAAAGEPLTPVAVDDQAAVTTVLAAAGYPEEPRRGDPITIPADLPADTIVFHAGTQRDEAGVLRTEGGRVLAVTALAPTVEAAQVKSRAAAESIDFRGKQFRTDIAWREVRRTAGRR
jgi:phosphoribosylamine--glycine ligase